MPPRKKLKTSQGASAPPQSTPTHERSESEYDPIITDPWTDDQETSLLKGIIRWKPVGMHKHFRMIAISDYMKSQGYVSPTEPHTRIPGIWKKLNTLYNLSALDEREESLATDASEDVEAAKELYCPFELPDEEYGEMMFERRLNPDGSPSPSEEGRETSRRPSTGADTDAEPHSSPAPSRTSRRGARSTRQTRGSTRSSRLQVEVDSMKGRSSDKESVANEDDTHEENNEDDDGTEAGRDGSDGDDDSKAAESPAPRTTRTQASRGRGKRGKGTKRGGRRR